MANVSEYCSNIVVVVVCEVEFYVLIIGEYPPFSYLRNLSFNRLSRFYKVRLLNSFFRSAVIGHWHRVSVQRLCEFEPSKKPSLMHLWFRRVSATVDHIVLCAMSLLQVDATFLHNRCRVDL